jgi:hypothetical protein
MNPLFKLLTFCIIFVSSFFFSQEKIQIKYSQKFQICQELDDALLKKDISKLEILLHPDLSLGHSNGWVETKESLLKHLPTSAVQYIEFQYQNEPEIHYEKENLISLRRNLTAIGKLKEKPFEVDLKILEVWCKENGIWQLLSRQSVEVNFED